MRPRTRSYTKWAVSFFRLPTEIRVMIYHILWDNATFVDVEHENGRHTYRVGHRHRDPDLNQDKVLEERHLFSLIQTCQFIRSEARPVLFDHLTVALRETSTTEQQPITTCVLLKEVQVVTCSVHRAVHLDLKEFSRLEVLAIADKSILCCGMSMEQARILMEADLLKLRRFYVMNGRKEDDAEASENSAMRIAKPVSSVLVGVDSARARNSAKTPAIRVQFRKEITDREMITIQNLSMRLLGAESGTVIPMGHTLELWTNSEGIEVHAHDDEAAPIGLLGTGFEEGDQVA